MKENSNRIILYGFKRGPDYASNPNRPLGLREIDCGLGHSPFGYPNEVDSVLKNIDPRLLNEYPRDPYADNLSRNVRERFGLREETQVFFDGAGSYGLLASILSTMVSLEARNRGVKVVGSGPQFTNIAMLAHRAQIPYCPLTPDIPIPYEQKIEDLIKERGKSREAAIVYIDNPNNPTGAAVNIDMLDRLAKATSNGDLLIIDEAYGDAINERDSGFNLVEEHKHLIVIRSLSKTVGLASPRLGYMVMSKPVADVYKEMRLVFTVDQLTYLIANKVMEPGILNEFLPMVRKMTTDNKLLFLSTLWDNGIETFDTEMSVSILLAKGGTSFYEQLFEMGITTEDGKTFQPTHPDMTNEYVRFRIPPLIEDIEEIGRRLAKLKK